MILFNELKTVFLSLSDRKIVEGTGLAKTYIKKVKQAMQEESICNLSKFLSTKEIGITTVQKTLLLLQNFLAKDAKKEDGNAQNQLLLKATQ